MSENTQLYLKINKHMNETKKNSETIAECQETPLSQQNTDTLNYH